MWLRKLRNKVRHLGSQDYLAGILSKADLGLPTVTLCTVCWITSDFHLGEGWEDSRWGQTELAGQVQRPWTLDRRSTSTPKSAAVTQVGSVFEPSCKLSCIPLPHTKRPVRRKQEAISQHKQRQSRQWAGGEKRGYINSQSLFWSNLRKVWAPKILELWVWQTCYFWCLILEPCPFSCLNSSVTEKPSTDMYS